MSATHCTAMFALSAPAVKPCTVASTNIGKLVRCTACQSWRGSFRIVHDVSWIATRRYRRSDAPRDRVRVARTTPSARTARAARSRRSCRPTAQATCTATNTTDNVPRNLCRSRNHAGTPLRRMRRVETTKPHTMLAVTTAHATSPDERAAYHDSLELTAADGRRSRSGLDLLGRLRGTSTPRTPVVRASATPSATPAIIIAFAMPSAHHASRGRGDDRHDRGPRRVTGTRVDDVVVLPIAARPRCGCGACSRRARRPRADARTRARSRSSGCSTGTRPRPVGRLAAGSHVTTEAHERGPSAAVDQPARHEVGRQALAEPTEIDAHPGRDSHTRRVDVDLDPFETARRGAVDGRSPRAASSSDELERPVVAGALERVEDRRIEQSRRRAVQVSRTRQREQHRRAHVDPLAGARVEQRELAVGPESAPALLEPLDLRERPLRRGPRARRRARRARCCPSHASGIHVQ